MEISKYECAAILAGLRLFQSKREQIDTENGLIWEIASGDRQYPPISDREIDTLCERLNFAQLDEDREALDNLAREV